MKLTKHYCDICNRQMTSGYSTIQRIVCRNPQSKNTEDEIYIIEDICPTCATKIHQLLKQIAPENKLVSDE